MEHGNVTYADCAKLLRSLNREEKSKLMDTLFRAIIDCFDAKSEPLPPSNAVGYYMDKFNRLASPTVIACLQHYKENLGADAVKHAIDTAVDEGKTSWSYVQAILRRYMIDGVRNMDDVRRIESQRQQKKPQAGNRPPSSQPKNAACYSAGTPAVSDRERSAVEEMQKWRNGEG